MENVIELSGREFENFTKEGAVLVDFYADWCMPCVMMAPIIEKLSKKFEGKIKFGRVNIDENRELAQKFKIMSIPNFVLFKKGIPKDQFVGAIPIDEFEKRIKKSL